MVKRLRVRDPVVPVIRPTMLVPFNPGLGPHHVHSLPEHQLSESIEIEPPDIDIEPPQSLLDQIFEIDGVPDLDAVERLKPLGDGGDVGADDDDSRVVEEVVEESWREIVVVLRG